MIKLRTPLAEKVKQKVELYKLLDEWYHDLELGKGIYSTEAYIVKGNFEEWLDAKYPAMAALCRNDINMMIWTKDFKKLYPRIKTKDRNKSGTIIFFNKPLQVKNPPPKKRYALCPTCNQLRQFDGDVVSAEELKQKLKNISPS